MTESKEASQEVPFNVFDIYDAYYGIPKTTTAPKVTTTAATTKRVVTTTTATTQLPPKYTSSVPTAATTKKTTAATVKTTAATVKTTAAPKTTAAATTQNTLLLSAPATSSASSSAESTTTEAVTTTVTTVTTVPGWLGGSYTNGVDVSEHQNLIDWEKVELSGIDYAIIRAGYGKELYQRDRFFDTNMQNIQKTDLDYGIYWFSYAMSVEEALQEAQTCCEMIKDYDGYTFPIYFDIELTCQRDYLTTAQVSAITETFCSYVNEQGYCAGIYSYSSFLETKIYKAVLEKYPVWVAQYGNSITWYQGNYGMWQYTSVGWVDGINYIVDKNYCYIDYPSLIDPELAEQHKMGRDIARGIVTTTATTTSTSVDTETTAAPGSSTGKTTATTTVASKTTTKPTATTTTTTATTTTTTTQPVPVFDPYTYETKGITVSGDNGYINWNSVRDAGYGFAVIRAGGGEETDPLFYVNMENAIAAGIYRGVYWEAQSTTKEDILKEAEAFYGIIKDYTYEYPIYLDMTSPAVTGAKLSKEELSEIITAFCSYFEDLRYYIGIRADEEFLCNALAPELFEAYDVFLVNSGDTPVFEYKYGVWQYGTEEVSGVLGDTEVAYCYRVYPSVMSFNGLNGR